MDDSIRKKRVLCPIEGKDGKTFWLRMGSGFLNKDASINVYLDCLPVNGKLQIRDWDDPPWEKRDPDGARLAKPAGGDRPRDELPF